eukprot:601421-Hanusia_phi.AAC.1
MIIAAARSHGPMLPPGAAGGRRRAGARPQTVAAVPNIKKNTEERLGPKLRQPDDSNRLSQQRGKNRRDTAGTE